jgi:disulfide bond formation protein DsbB
MTPTLFALVFSLVAAAGSLFLSLGLGLLACPLCFYQRTFAFALVGLLLVGLALPNREPRRLCVLALPLAVGGLGVAAFHTYLVASGKLECPLGVGGLGSAPAQSLAIYVLITLSLLVGVIGEVRVNAKLIPASLLALGLGGLATYGSIAANPSPKKADAPVSDLGTLKTCQVPFGK